MKNREPIHVDITKKGVTVDHANASGNTEKVTQATWDPGAGADAARQRIEAEIKREHQRQMDAYESDPTVRRVHTLEDQVATLSAQVVTLIQRFEEYLVKAHG